MILRLELYSSGNRILFPENQNFYNLSFTLHGFLMIFFLVMPGLYGGFGNYFVPIFLGAPEVGFPRVNSFSFLLLPVSYGFLLVSTASEFPGGAGWTLYPPLSTSLMSLSPVAVDLIIDALLVAGVSSFFSSLNFFATIGNMRLPGCSLGVLPLFPWGILITAVLLLLTLPILSLTRIPADGVFSFFSSLFLEIFIWLPFVTEILFLSLGHNGPNAFGLNPEGRKFLSRSARLSISIFLIRHFSFLLEAVSSLHCLVSWSLTFIPKSNGKARMISALPKGSDVKSFDKICAKILQHLVYYEFSGPIRGGIRVPHALGIELDCFLSNFLSQLEIADGHEDLRELTASGEELLQLFLLESRHLPFTIGGPLELKLITLHGFLPKCSVASCLVSLEKRFSLFSGKDLIFEKDLSAAFEQVRLGEIYSNRRFVEKAPLCAAFIRALRFQCVFPVNACINKRSVLRIGKTLSVEALLKQYPLWGSKTRQIKDTYFYPAGYFPQGSALTPIIFNLWIISKVEFEKADTLRRSSSFHCVSYADNFFVRSEDLNTLESFGLEFKSGVPTSKTHSSFGLSWQSTGDGRFNIHSDWIPYAKGVASRLNKECPKLHFTFSGNRPLDSK